MAVTDPDLSRASREEPALDLLKRTRIEQSRSQRQPGLAPVAALKQTLKPNAVSLFPSSIPSGGSHNMWVWVIDQLWTFICIGIAGGIAGAIYQSRRTPNDSETSAEETQSLSERGFSLS